MNGFPDIERGIVRMKIIDLEAHFFTETYVDYLRKNKEFPRLETVGAEGGKGEGAPLARRGPLGDAGCCQAGASRFRGCQAR